MNPLVSLITPVYNAMPYLKEYLESVCSQTWRPMELILADDGSGDDSVDFIKSFWPEFEKADLSVSLLILPHAGQAAATNSALKQAKGKYLTWCDADDIMLPECVEKKARYLEEHPEIGMVRNDGLHIDADTNTVVSNSAKESDRCTKDVFYDLFRQYTYCYAGCYMIRMSLFDECYPDREIPLSPEGQNLQLLLPPASRTKCGFIPDVLHWYCRRGSGHSSKHKSYTQYRSRILNFSKLYRDILPYCVCDKEFYENEIKEIEKEQLELIYYSVIQQAREGLKKK